MSCNFIGYNFKYGSDFARSYSCRNILIKEIRDSSLSVYGFDQNMLDMICVLFYVNSNPNLCIFIFVLNFNLVVLHSNSLFVHLWCELQGEGLRGRR